MLMWGVSLAAWLVLGGCSDGSDSSGNAQDRTLRMNQIQVLGTHNSYHIEPRASILEVLSQFDPETALELEYTALPLAEQFDRGVRQIELDLFADPEGGLYAQRRGLLVVGQDPESGLPELDEPGMKVLHVQDIDFETHCLTFKLCLTQMRDWSDLNPGHLPIIVMIEGKEDAIPDPLDLGFVVPLPFGPAEVDAIDQEILSIFAPSRLIVPDDIRRGQDTLEQAVLNSGWLTLAEARGRFMFVFLNRSAARDAYLDGHPSLVGRVMFTNSSVGDADAAWVNVNNSLNDFQLIRNLVDAGYIVRTRADADTYQAREGDYSLQESAWASGGHTVSTDYVVPDPDYDSGYTAQVPGGFVARCNPVNAPMDCDSSLIAP
ncbi:MAG: phosphatidylinositol-specific phospholipase C1-like protein [Halioglobus sp.]